MSYSFNRHSKKLLKQRETKAEQKLNYQLTVLSSSDDDTDSTDDHIYDGECNLLDKEPITRMNSFEKGHSEECYLSDKNDFMRADAESTFELDDTPPFI